MSLDHYVGRSVESVHETDSGWKIKLEGDIEIANYDAEIAEPEIAGLALLAVVHSSGSTDTELVFGRTVKRGDETVIEERQDVTFRQGTYSLLDSRLGELSLTPGVEPLPPDPSSDRVAQEPLGQPVASSEALLDGEEG